MKKIAECCNKYPLTISLNLYLLAFEFDSKNERLEIHGNQKGLEKLINVLNSLLAKNDNDYEHLMTSEWGGNELSDNKQNPDDILINHVKIFKWDN